MIGAQGDFTSSRSWTIFLDDVLGHAEYAMSMQRNELSFTVFLGEPE
jgi:hypothetical protein